MKDLSGFYSQSEKDVIKVLKKHFDTILTAINDNRYGIPGEKARINLLGEYIDAIFKGVVR